MNRRSSPAVALGPVVVGRRRATSQPMISGGTAAISIRLGARRWTMWPAAKRPGVGAQAASTQAATKSTAKTSSTRRAGSSCTARTVPKQ